MDDLTRAARPITGLGRMLHSRRRSLNAFSHSWRSLRHRNFRQFFIGQTVLLIGSWMMRVAISWLVYRLTRSALVLGVVSFAGQMACLVVGPFAGVWVERFEQRKLLVVTQTAAAVQVLALAALTLIHAIALWEIIALMSLQGLINAFDMPGRQSFLVRMIEDRNDLGNAIAIHSSMANTARLIGPAIAGGVIAAVGEGWCLVISGISYLAGIMSLVTMQLRTNTPRVRSISLLEQIQEGGSYVWQSPPIRTMLILFALTTLLGGPYPVLLPILAGHVLHGDARTLGWLLSASGAGALTSGLSLATRRSVMGLPQVLHIACVTLGGALVLLGFSHTLWASLLLMTLFGFALTQVASGSNTIIQTLVPDNMRGRLMSYYTMTFFGAASLGSLFAATLAHRIGVRVTVMALGTSCLAGALWLSAQLPNVRAALRAICRRNDLLAEERASSLAVSDDQAN